MHVQRQPTRMRSMAEIHCQGEWETHPTNADGPTVDKGHEETYLEQLIAMRADAKGSSLHVSNTGHEHCGLRNTQIEQELHHLTMSRARNGPKWHFLHLTPLCPRGVVPHAQHVTYGPHFSFVLLLIKSHVMIFCVGVKHTPGATGPKWSAVPGLDTDTSGQSMPGQSLSWYTLKQTHATMQRNA